MSRYAENTSVSTPSECIPEPPIVWDGSLEGAADE